MCWIQLILITSGVMTSLKHALRGHRARVIFSKFPFWIIIAPSLHFTWNKWCHNNYVQCHVYSKCSQKSEFSSGLKPENRRLINFFHILAIIGKWNFIPPMVRFLIADHILPVLQDVPLLSDSLLEWLPMQSFHPRWKRLAPSHFLKITCNVTVYLYYNSH